jgi:hypothetical protein
MAILGRDPVDAWLGGKSLLLKRIQGWLHRRNYEDKSLDVARRVDRDPSVWLATQEGLRHIRDLCAARDVRFVVAVLPMLSQLDATLSLPPAA